MRRSLRMSFLARGRRSLCAALPLVTPFWPPPPAMSVLFEFGDTLRRCGGEREETCRREGTKESNSIVKFRVLYTYIHTSHPPRAGTEKPESVNKTCDSCPCVES